MYIRGNGWWFEEGRISREDYWELKQAWTRNLGQKLWE